jgi:plasmid stabilization system protein ParE
MDEIRLIWMPDALSHVAEHRKFIAKHSTTAARQFVANLSTASSVLKTFPYAGAIEPLLADKPVSYRSLVADKNHKLIYTVTDHIVEIHAVWDCRQSEEVLKQIINPV